MVVAQLLWLFNIHSACSKCICISATVTCIKLRYSNHACVLKAMFGVQLTAVQSASESLQRVSNAMAIESHRRRRCDTHCQFLFGVLWQLLMSSTCVLGHLFADSDAS